MAVGHYWDLKGQSYSIEDDIKRIPYQTTGHKKKFCDDRFATIASKLEKVGPNFLFFNPC